MMKPTVKTINDYFPESIRLMMTVISIGSLQTLIKTQGGTKISIPATAKPGHWLADVIGMDDLKKLAAVYGGCAIAIPRCAKLLSLERDIKILQDSRKRLTGNQLALKYGMTERGIQKALRRIEPYERQAWLKDLQITLPGNN